MSINPYVASIECARNRTEAAIMYELWLSEPPPYDWAAEVNAAIVEKWSLSGLDWIKRLAWKIRTESRVYVDPRALP